MDALNTALSGLRAAEKRLDVSAENIANINSKDGKAKEVVQKSQNEGGVIVDVRDRNPAQITVPSLDGGTEQLPNVSLEQEVGIQIKAAADFEANLAVIKRQKEIDKSTLDILA